MTMHNYGRSRVDGEEITVCLVLCQQHQAYGDLCALDQGTDVALAATADASELASELAAGV